jgi:Zn ribbon nucleic-acid-binding protein
VQNGPLKFFVWLALIYFKAHLKDKYLRFNLGQRLPAKKIADSLQLWNHLHHFHCISRCFYNNATIAKEVFGSMLVLSIKTNSGQDNFYFANLYAARTMMLILGNVVIITVFDDSCGAVNGLMPTLERINRPHIDTTIS